MHSDMERWAACLRNRVPYQSIKPVAVWDEQLEEEIKQASLPGLLKAGFYLWNDSLSNSHAYAQQEDHALGSCWHGVMHRMEGDYSNAKYWFRQAGRQPFYGKLQEAAAGIAEEAWPRCGAGQAAQLLRQIAEAKEWNPFAFADAVEAALAERNAEAIRALERMQRLEMCELLEASYQYCCGGTLFEAL